MYCDSGAPEMGGAIVALDCSLFDGVLIPFVV